jgi:apolipoprotein N-acyltransferase
MKDLKITNTIAILIPLVLLLIGFVEEGLFYLAAYSTMLTGLLQIIIGLIYWNKYRENLYIKIYFLLVIAFFSLWYYNENINYVDSLTWVLICFPLILCNFLSIIIYTKKQTR